MRGEVVLKAREYLGTPFHHQGRVKGVGVDCAGLLVCVARELGLNPIDDTTYDHDPHPDTLRAYLDAQPFLGRVTIFDRDIGDILLMALSSRMMRGHHLGIVSDIGIIHAYAHARGVVETVLDATMARSIVGVYRWQS
jgi:cell wall-associated NlpC family hydrolase